MTTRWKLRAVVTTLSLLCALTAVTIAGCAGPKHAADQTGKEGAVTIEGRPSMEMVLRQYRAFRQDLFDRLDAHFGKRKWVVFRSLSVGVCGNAEPDAGQETSLEGMGFYGAYPAPVWAEVRDVVVETGRKHGFEHVTWIADEPGNLDFFGRDQLGGEYHFALGNNAVFSLSTGCLLWGATPHATP